MKRKMEDLDTLMEDTMTLCRTPPIPPKHPNRALHPYRKSLPATPKDDSKPMEMDGAFTFEMELVPKPLFSRSVTLPAAPFQVASVDEKNPSSSFSRRNTVPPRPSRFAPAEKGPSPLVSRQNSLPSNSRPARFATVKKSPLPPSKLSQGDARPPGPTLIHFAPVEPTSPMILSPAISALGSPASSSAPSIRSSNASIISSPPSTPGSSPPTSPYVHSPKFCAPPSSTCYFPPSSWVPSSPSPVYIPRNALRRKASPHADTLRDLRAKHSDVSLRNVYNDRSSVYGSGPTFTSKAPSGLKMVLQSREEQTKRRKSYM